jgi:hypothetical protein
MCCFRRCGRQLSLRDMPISGVNSTPRPTAVYASEPASPRRDRQLYSGSQWVRRLPCGCLGTPRLQYIECVPALTQGAQQRETSCHRPRPLAAWSSSLAGPATSPATASLQLLNEGWRVRTTMRNLGRAEEVRATIGNIAEKAGAIEFAAADLNLDAGWTNAVAGLTMSSMSHLLSRRWTRKATTN